MEEIKTVTLLIEISILWMICDCESVGCEPGSCKRTAEHLTTFLIDSFSDSHSDFS